jgi:hypothetical protein
MEAHLGGHRQLCTLSSDIFINKLGHARRRVLRGILSRGLNQGKTMCVPCVCSVVAKAFHPHHLPNNLGGVDPPASEFQNLTSGALGRGRDICLCHLL